MKFIKSRYKIFKKEVNIFFHIFVKETEQDMSAKETLFLAVDGTIDEKGKYNNLEAFKYIK